MGVDPDKIIVIAQRPPPPNVYELKVVLGLTVYYSKQIPNYADMGRSRCTPSSKRTYPGRGPRPAQLPTRP